MLSQHSMTRWGLMRTKRYHKIPFNQGGNCSYQRRILKPILKPILKLGLGIRTYLYYNVDKVSKK